MVRKGNALHLRLEATLSSVAERGRKKSRPVSFDGASLDFKSLRAISFGQLLHGVGQMLIDANTVEAILLAAAMLICLFGILFEASANTVGDAASQFFQDSRNAILAVCLAVIVLSILYWLVVVAVDIFVVVQAKRIEKARESARHRQSKMLGGSHKGLVIHTDRRPTSQDAAITLQRLEASESSVNPLFVPSDSNDASVGIADPSAIASLKGLPDAVTWHSVREAYLAALKANEELQATIDSMNTQPHNGDFERNRKVIFQPVNVDGDAGSRNKSQERKNLSSQ